jgi:hypothetical protein
MLNGKRPSLDCDPRGAIAQLGERLDRTQEVAGSSPASSIRKPWKRGLSRITWRHSPRRHDTHNAIQGLYEPGIAQALAFADLEYNGEVFYGGDEDGALDLVT